MDDMTLDVAYVGNVNKKQVGYDPINSAVTPGPGPIQPRRLLPDFGDLDGGNNKFNSNTTRCESTSSSGSAGGCN